MIKYWGIQEGRGEDEEEGKEEADTILFHYYNITITNRHLGREFIYIMGKYRFRPNKSTAPKETEDTNMAQFAQQYY